MELIDPEVIVTGKKSSILSLATLFPNLILPQDLQKLDLEYRELVRFDFDSLFDKLPSAQSFWKIIAEVKRNDGEKVFLNISNFAFKLLSLPNSSANVERVFSQTNLNVTKPRNRLEVDTLSGILFTKDYLKFNNMDCTNFEITNDLFMKCNSNMY